jgi:hypothetical protein
MLFNGLGVVLMLPFVRVFELLLYKLVPEKQNTATTETEAVPY